MPEPLGVEQAEKLARNGPSVANQLRRIVERLLTRHRLARKLFLGADGELTPHAAEWMRRLARENFVSAPTYSGDRDQQLINEGKRLLALEILGSTRLDVERLGALTRQEREVNA